MRKRGKSDHYEKSYSEDVLNRTLFLDAAKPHLASSGFGETKDAEAAERKENVGGEFSSLGATSAAGGDMANYFLTDARAHSPALQFDPEEYWEHLSGYDLTDDEKCALLAALWKVVTACVDMGFRLHPVQREIALEDESPRMVPLQGSNNSNEEDEGFARDAFGAATREDS
jgi:hypothetical protein